MRDATPAVRPKGASIFTHFALLLSLVVYPVLYSCFIGSIVECLSAENSRLCWWYFWTAIFASHWVTFGFVWLALQQNGESWQSLGVNWEWFLKYKVWFGVLIGGLIFLAAVLPSLYYGEMLTAKSRFVPIAPISSLERIVVLGGIVTVSVTEEVIFRGFAFTRLNRLIKSAWLILPITVVSFIFIHGVPRSTDGLIFYTAAGLAYGIAFILMKCRQLELLITAHFLASVGIVLTP